MLVVVILVSVLVVLVLLLLVVVVVVLVCVVEVVVVVVTSCRSPVSLLQMLCSVVLRGKDETFAMKCTQGWRHMVE